MMKGRREMIKYLIVLLDDAGTSFCHYDVPAVHRLIPIDVLKRGIGLALKENLEVQFVYPDTELPDGYEELIDEVDHIDIRSVTDKRKADVRVCESILQFAEIEEFDADIYALRIPKGEFFRDWKCILPNLERVKRLNVTFTDDVKFTDGDAQTYMMALDEMADELCRMYVRGVRPQFNALTDRMMLTGMKNCGAGSDSITLASDGKFYPCPAFYYAGCGSSGDVETGIDLANPQLYRLDHAPLCRRCDAYQCRRCIWLNRKYTNEICVPSHGQCIAAHVERNASRRLLAMMKDAGVDMSVPDIPAISYLDPMDRIEIF